MTQTKLAKTFVFRIDRLATPVGEMLVVQDEDQRVRALDWEDYEARMERLFGRYYGTDTVTLKPGDGRGSVVQALKDYLDGDLHAIDRIETAAEGTAFQQRVWRELRKIPCGETWSYGELAKRIGKPSASRAVGHANGANPIGVIVPCHRVVGANRSLTGYGGGLERKQWLLEHEGVLIRGPVQLPLV